MCSISGLLTTDSTDREVIARMNAAQTHRGPDDEGVWTLGFERGGVALGNTRLAIIDTTSAGHQPMFDPVTGNCITYNGETYNFKALSESIRVNARSRADTEVVLHAYSEFGTDLFS
jgi:asparagine synthase (glutamine-hydrolysing)